MKKPLIFIMIIILFSIIGCAKPVFYQPGCTDEQIRRDYLECKLYGTTHGAAAGYNPFLAVQLINECMAVKGYTW